MREAAEGKIAIAIRVGYTGWANARTGDLVSDNEANRQDDLGDELLLVGERATRIVEAAKLFYEMHPQFG